jgi:hypothetical protein
MKCKRCWKEFYNPYSNTGYCSKTCEDQKDIKEYWDNFINEFFWWFNYKK